MKKLEILNVDLEMLEEQRKALAELAHLIDNRQYYRVDSRHLSALDGVVNMLDAWSDERYFSRCDV